MSKVYQCFDESLIIYPDTCLDLIFILNWIIIAHIFRHEQTSGYQATHGVSHVPQKPMVCLANISKAGLELTASATNETFSAGENENWRKPIVDHMQILAKG